MIKEVLHFAQASVTLEPVGSCLASAWVRMGFPAASGLPPAASAPAVSAALEMITNQIGLLNMLIFMAYFNVRLFVVWSLIRSIITLPENPSCRFEALTVADEPAEITVSFCA